ncbi:ectoine/hydroxyectoine ABC transporter [Striga asiatica]|uniref:Ectoine/hydroxyectoine ABC transporter n=1 Tax=Striga asiatica TaxID=4170 RepID=A0A5A7PUF7_STRAF|nr:ectoine/hydroxyectoine ABC transporter [Striga asiatica]
MNEKGIAPGLLPSEFEVTIVPNLHQLAELGLQDNQLRTKLLLMRDLLIMDCILSFFTDGVGLLITSPQTYMEVRGPWPVGRIAPEEDPATTKTSAESKAADSTGLV